VIAQVGAILILAKPENQQKLPFFAGIERVRYRKPVHPGDVVVIEVIVKRLAEPDGGTRRQCQGGRQARRRRHDDVRAGTSLDRRL
jgi:3-hydroxyacyl-[acyl-carrier-protein] dehydratase